MNGKFTTSCLLFLLSAGSHAAESNLRGGSRSLAPEPELFGLVGGGETNTLTSFQPDMTTFPPNLASGSQFGPFQFPTGVVVTTTFPPIPAVPPTSPFQFPTGVVGTTPFPSIPVVPFQLDPTKLFQIGTPNLDYDGNILGGPGLGGPLVGGGSCPKGPDNIPCTLNYLPLSCGGCVYDNDCLAKAAGFSESQCKPVPF
jgi:hypothetical protein